jgi:hypothetical protein
MNVEPDDFKRFFTRIYWKIALAIPELKTKTLTADGLNAENYYLSG